MGEGWSAGFRPAYLNLLGLQLAKVRVRDRDAHRAGDAAEARREEGEMGGVSGAEAAIRPKVVTS